MNWLSGSKHNEARKLVRQLKDAAKRSHAAGELLKLGQNAVLALIEALQTEDPDLLRVYRGLLLRFGTEAAPALVHALENNHPLIRRQAAQVLGEIKDPKAIPALLAALNGEFYTVRAGAALALGSMGAQEAVQPLVDLLKDTEADVRIAAVTALGMFNLPDTFDNMADPLLEDPQIEVRQAAAKALGATKHPQAVPYLMLALRDPFWWYEREKAAAELLETLQEMGELVLHPLLDALSDGEGTVRRFAATLLGHIGDTRAVAPLGMALYDTHFEVGQAAAAALAGFGAEGLKVLAEALGHPEAWLRQHAIAGLTLSGDRRILPAIMNMLNDPERDVQVQAIRSLGALKDERALPALQAIAANRADREMYALARAAISEIQTTK